MENAVFVSEFFNLGDELERLGVFDAVINTDSPFFINVLRLKQTTVPELSHSYEKINAFFSDIMRLLCASQEKGDRMYREALRRFDFSGVNGINLGFSESGVDAGFGRILSQKVIGDAYDIVKAGSTQPEIFQLVGLFEENVAADRLSDMIATLIKEDIINYTRRINEQLSLNESTYPQITFVNGIAVNPYKHCELLYLPKDILHELPIAKCWDDIDRVISENETIRREVNEAIGNEWYKLGAAAKKHYLKEQIFKDPLKCVNVINGYRQEQIGEFNPETDIEYFINDTFRKIKKSGAFDFLEHANNTEISSWDASLKVLGIFKHWVEDNRGWDLVIETTTRKREKAVQSLIHLSGLQYCKDNNIDMSFEANEGPGPVDLTISRGNDKTVIEVKLSSNDDYLHGYEEQIERYAQAEETDKRIYVYVQVGNPGRDEKIRKRHEERINGGENPPLLYMIDSQKQMSASRRA